MPEGMPEQTEDTPKERKPHNFGNGFLDREVHVTFISVPEDDKYDAEKLAEYGGGV